MRVKCSLRVYRQPTLDRPWAAQANACVAKHLAHAPTAQRHQNEMVRNGLADHLDSVRAIVNNSSHPRKPRHEVKLHHSSGSPRHGATVVYDWFKRAPACAGFPRIPGNDRLNEIAPHHSAAESGSRDSLQICAWCWRGPAGNPLSSYSFCWLAGGTMPFIRRYSTIWPY